QLGDVAHDVLVEAAPRGRTGVVLVVPPEPVVPNRGDRLVLGHGCVGRTRHQIPSVSSPCGDGVVLGRPVGTVVVGMWVVHTCSPPASVARRWTWTPRRRENARVSASQSWW